VKREKNVFSLNNLMLQIVHHRSSSLLASSKKHLQSIQQSLMETKQQQKLKLEQNKGVIEGWKKRKEQLEQMIRKVDDKTREF